MTRRPLTLLALGAALAASAACTQETQNELGRSIQNWTGTDGVLEEGVRRGELPKRLPVAAVVQLLVATSYGLSWSHGISTPAQHDVVMGAFEALLEGTLFREDST